MPGNTTLDPNHESQGNLAATGPLEHRLVLVWSAVDVNRLGESLRVGLGRAMDFGRDTDGGDRPSRARLVRERPGEITAGPPLDNPFLSRRQLLLRGEPDALIVENTGKRAIRVDGVVCDSPTPLRAGSTLELDAQMLFLCTGLSARMGPLVHGEKPHHPFGGADEHGIVGESAAAWALRDRIAFAGTTEAHALVLGESGSGKELVVQAIHRLSPRRDHRLVARSAATLPAGLVEAELFGNAPNYPNAGMPERPGLVGEADRSTLFLDEIGELPSELQARLLRVLDGGGDYQRLGDARRRRADVRVIAATNRVATSLKHDVAARLAVRVAVPSLNERREDIVLLANHLIRRRAQKEPLVRRFLDAEGAPRMHIALARALSTHEYTTHVRELEALLLSAIASSPGSRLELTSEVRGSLGPQDSDSPGEPRVFTAEEIRAALAKHDGVLERVWRELGMSNRYVLRRAMRKHGIAGEGDDR